MVRGISLTEKLFIGEDLKEHTGSTSRGYDDVHESSDFGDRNEGVVNTFGFR